MSYTARSALVLRGGAALGAYELGAARALYEGDEFAPDLIAGVSIGAIAAGLPSGSNFERLFRVPVQSWWADLTRAISHPGRSKRARTKDMPEQKKQIAEARRKSPAEPVARY